MSDIPLSEVTQRGVYRIHSRNLSIGVFNGATGFIGIRHKFGSRYLFTEYHWDTGAPYGTVKPQELLEYLPDDVSPYEADPITCGSCGTRAWWTGPPGPAPWACEGGCDEVRPLRPQNKLLFSFLEEMIRKYCGHDSQGVLTTDDGHYGLCACGHRTAVVETSQKARDLAAAHESDQKGRK